MRATIILFSCLLIIESLFSQKDSTKTLGEVYIKSIRANRQMSTTANTIKVSELQHLNLGQDIPTLIQQLPSINVSSDAGAGVGYSYLYIRGMDAQRIQVNINGVPYNDAESQEVYWVNIPDILSSADDIQIQRGIGYSTMGGTGLGGSVSIKTTKKYLSPFVTFNTSLGSFNTFRNTLNMSTGILKDGWQVTARGSYIQSDGYIDRAWSKLGSAYLDLSKYDDKFSTHLILTHGREKTYQAWYGVSQSDFDAGWRTKNIAGTDYESKTGSPYDNQIDNYQQTHLQWINNFLWSNGHQSSITGYFSKGKGYYEEYKVGQDYSSYAASLSGNGDLVRRLWLNNYLLGFNASHIIEKRKWTNTTAFSFHHYSGYHFGTIRELLSSYSGIIPNEFYQNQSDKSDITAFNKFVYKQGKSNFVIDVQIRNVIYNASGILRTQNEIQFDKNYLFFNPKIGWNIELNQGKKWKDRLFAFAGLSHREPVRSDFTDADNTMNPKPEEVYNLEIGYQRMTPKWNLNANVFGMYFIDQLIPTGNVNSVGSPIRENVSNSYRAGAEFELTYKFNSLWEVYTNQYLALNKILDYTNYLIAYNSDYSINEAKTIRQFYSSTDIAFSPSWISYAAIRFQPFKNTRFEFMNKIVGSQYLDNTMSENKSLPLYSFTNISISHKLKLQRGIKEIDLNLLLNNILNQKYSTRGYTYFSGNTVNADGSLSNGQDYNYYFPQAGFNFLLGVGFRF